eukprot:GILI01055811.1.p2 GENE.GILI01055811.1~~GILI01055811.1.p2  ORF type:complete len:107 (+),score=12.65 GILI01055811.1:198-518(+)
MYLLLSTSSHHPLSPILYHAPPPALLHALPLLFHLHPDHRSLLLAEILLSLSTSPLSAYSLSPFQVFYLSVLFFCFCSSSSTRASLSLLLSSSHPFPSSVARESFV